MNVEREVIQDNLRREWPEQAKIAQRLIASSTRTYLTHGERAAMRCALDDAASLCDAMVRDIENLNRGLRGRVTVEGEKKARIAKHCAEAISLMRDLVRVHD